MRIINFNFRNGWWVTYYFQSFYCISLLTLSWTPISNKKSPFFNVSCLRIVRKQRKIEETGPKAIFLPSSLKIVKSRKKSCKVCKIVECKIVAQSVQLFFFKYLIQYRSLHKFCLNFEQKFESKMLKSHQFSYTGLTENTSLIGSLASKEKNCRRRIVSKAR